MNPLLLLALWIVASIPIALVIGHVLKRLDPDEYARVSVMKRHSED